MVKNTTKKEEIKVTMHEEDRGTDKENQEQGVLGAYDQKDNMQTDKNQNK
jgi:hypothetical protein